MTARGNTELHTAETGKMHRPGGGTGKAHGVNKEGDRSDVRLWKITRHRLLCSTCLQDTATFPALRVPPDLRDNKRQLTECWDHETIRSTLYRKAVTGNGVQENERATRDRPSVTRPGASRAGQRIAVDRLNAV